MMTVSVGYTFQHKHTAPARWSCGAYLLLLTFKECHLYLLLQGSWVTIMLLYFVLTEAKIFVH